MKVINLTREDLWRTYEVLGKTVVLTDYIIGEKQALLQTNEGPLLVSHDTPMVLAD